MGTVPLIALRVGDVITPRMEINSARVAHWRYAAECSPLMGTSIAPGARLRVVEIGTVAGAMWVRVELPGRFPPGFLKIAGEEYSACFESAPPGV